MKVVTAIIRMGVSSAVLLRDMSAGAGDVSMRITIFPITLILSRQIRKNREAVRLRQR